MNPDNAPTDGTATSRSVTIAVSTLIAVLTAAIAVLSWQLLATDDETQTRTVKISYLDCDPVAVARLTAVSNSWYNEGTPNGTPAAQSETERILRIVCGPSYPE